MSEKFFLIRIIDGVEIRRVSFVRKDLKQVAEGLTYAAVRDSLPERRKFYGVLNKRFWGLLR